MLLFGFVSPSMGVGAVLMPPILVVFELMGPRSFKLPSGSVIMQAWVEPPVMTHGGLALAGTAVTPLLLAAVNWPRSPSFLDISASDGATVTPWDLC